MEGGLVTPADWARAYRALAAELERIAAERRVSHRDWLDQGASPLGRKRHCAAARRRVAAGKPDAAIVGRRHLLSSAALAEELGNISKPRAKPEPPKDIADELRAELRLVGGTH
jgi:hypothetical protein